MGLAVLLLLPGCVMPEQLSQLQKDVADVRQRLQQIEGEQAEVREEVEAIAARADDEPEDVVTRSELADLNLRLERLSRDTAVAEQRIGELDRRYEQVSEDVAQTRDMVQRGSYTGVPLTLGATSPPTESAPLLGAGEVPRDRAG
jgi:predicted nuclease with TOPRIM domain